MSGAIAALEARHNIVLFNRVGRRVELTGNGRAFLDKAREVLSSASAAEASLLELRGLKREIITLQASQTTGAYWLPERLARFFTQNIRTSISSFRSETPIRSQPRSAPVAPRSVSSRASSISPISSLNRSTTTSS